ncbi:MAG: transcription termination factor Rho [Desulfomonile sp.]|nr:transcription termination factor Rho [Desulfomonile sp.]
MAGKKEQKEKKEKPLERWTVKEMREEALKLGEIQGVHGMNKEELMRALRKAKGIPEPAKKGVASVRELKAKVRAMREARDNERAEGASRKRLAILRRKISRAKKQTRA